MGGFVDTSGTVLLYVGPLLGKSDSWRLDAARIISKKFLVCSALVSHATLSIFAFGIEQLEQ